MVLGGCLWVVSVLLVGCFVGRYCGASWLCVGS